MNERFTHADMIGYGHAAYCAGWKAAIRIILTPGKGGSAHGYEWLKTNPPRACGEPLWRGLPPLCPAPEKETPDA